MTHCLRCDPSMFQVPFNFPPRLNERGNTPVRRLLRFINKGRERKKKRKEADCSSFLQPEKSSKHELHYSALPSLHDNTADKQELFSNQTATTVEHSYFKPLVNGAPSD